ncbi:MAG TPA: TerC family protein [bacterium]|nr:TerC family protein [bacterium]
MSKQTLMWIAFNAAVVVMLALDLGVFNRKAHEVKLREALVWSAVWIAVSLAFNLFIYFELGRETALNFLTGYLLEKSLSVDNLFVFLLIFSYFKTPPQYEHKVLFWGIIGALFMRAAFIFAGVALIHRFEWVIYVFGALLLVTGIRLAFKKDDDIRPEKNPVLRVFRRFFRVSFDFKGGKFYYLDQGKFLFTPLFVALLVVETTDVIFALDSIPAVLAITTDPFIVYSSNVFAILGLRALFFALAGVMRMFHYLQYGLALILSLIGVKMLASKFYQVPVHIALGGIAAVLALSILASLIWPPQGEDRPDEEKINKDVKDIQD